MTPEEARVTRSEEELDVATSREPYGTLRLHKDVETVTVEDEEPRRREDVGEIDRVPAAESDSGEIEVLEDGSISIPVMEERLVVSRELVVRERVIVRKVTETQLERIRADLRRERVTLEGDPSVLDEVDGFDREGSPSR